MRDRGSARGRITARGRPSRGQGGSDALKALVKRRHQRFAARGLADQRCHLADSRTDIRDVARDAEFRHRKSRLLQQRDRRPRREGAGHDKIGIERNDLFGEAVIDRYIGGQIAETGVGRLTAAVVRPRRTMAASVGAMAAFQVRGSTNAVP